MTHSIIIATFEIESEAYQALAELKQNPGNKDSFVSQAVLARKENGKLNTLEKYDTGSHTTDDTMMGGLLGAVIGVLGGPIGIIFGGLYGLIIGNAIDSTDAYKESTLIAQIAGKMEDGQIAIIGLAMEKDESVLDERLNKFKVTIVRYDSEEVAKEVKEAKRVAKEMARVARTEMQSTDSKEENV